MTLNSSCGFPVPGQNRVVRASSSRWPSPAVSASSATPAITPSAGRSFAGSALAI